MPMQFDQRLSAKLDNLKLNTQLNKDIQTPRDGGPSVFGKTPYVGTIRRNFGAPVARDEIGEAEELVNQLDI